MRSAAIPFRESPIVRILLVPKALHRLPANRATEMPAAQGIDLINIRRSFVKLNEDLMSCSKYGVESEMNVHR